MLFWGVCLSLFSDLLLLLSDLTIACCRILHCILQHIHHCVCSTLYITVVFVGTRRPGSSSNELIAARELGALVWHTWQVDPFLVCELAPVQSKTRQASAAGRSGLVRPRWGETLCFVRISALNVGHTPFNVNFCNHSCRPPIKGSHGYGLHNAKGRGSDRCMSL